jgi:DNA-binding LacI/PurR family transcriptional regulator
MTLFDLAQELNVSISTISRALSRPEMVAPVTREKVLAAVKQFGFQPNEIAGPRPSASLFPTLRTGFLAQLLRRWAKLPRAMVTQCSFAMPMRIGPAKSTL